MNDAVQPVPAGYLSLKEAAEILGFHRETVREWADKGLIRAYFIGKRWLFTAADINEYVQSHSNQPNSKPQETE